MHLVLLDLNNLLCRAFFAGDKKYTTKNKIPFGAISALATYMHNILRMLAPTHVIVARDLGGKTWRHKLYPSYKQNRPKSDPELYVQFQLLEPLIEHMGLTMVGDEDHEADDYIGTLVKKYTDQSHITVVSSDKDLFQLLNKKVRVYSPHAKDFYTIDNVVKKYDVEIHQLIDYFTMCGDMCDNLPGVPGIGPKSATKILQCCDTLEEALQKTHFFSKNVANKLIQNKDSIPLMKQLISLKTDIEIEDSIIEVSKFSTFADVRQQILDEIMDRQEVRYKEA